MYSIAEAIPLLKRVPVFGGLDDLTLAQIAARCVPRSVAGGTLLFAEGEGCRGLYVVETGRVRVYRTSGDGREHTLSIEEVGSPIALLPMLDGGAYPVSAMTLEFSRLFFLPREVFEHALRTNPIVNAAVIRWLGRRVRQLVEITDTLAFRNVAARLAMLLAIEAEARGEPRADGIHLPGRRTQEELGTRVGAARESVSRAMRRLVALGLVRRPAPARLIVPDPVRLRAFASRDEDD